MAKKPFKDEKIVRHFADLLKDSTYDKQNQALLTHFFYGDAQVDVIFRFRGRHTSRVSFMMNDVYEAYGKARFEDIDKFAAAVVGTYALEIEHHDEFLWIHSDCKENSFENSWSDGLSTAEVLCEILNKVLGLNLENPFDEQLIRGIHIDYLKKKKWIFFAAFAGSFAVALIFLIVFIANGGSAHGVGGLLGLFLFISGLLGGIVFLFPYLHYRGAWKRAIQRA